MRRRFKMASSCKGVPVPPNYESRYSVMDEDFSPSLHILDQSERELCGNEVYLLLLHRVSLAGRRKMKVERKKEKEEEIRPNWAFRPIMEQLDSKGLELSEGTSSMAQ